MRHESLSATLNKKDENGNALPNLVTVSNSVRNKDSVPDGAKVPVLEIRFPAELMQYPQFDTFDEFVSDCGGTERALEVINDMTQKVATSAGKAAIRTATSGSEDEIIELGLRTSRTFTWREEQKLAVKDKAARFDEIMKLAGQLPAEELARRIAELASK